MKTPEVQNRAAQFIDTVRALKPAIAVFDCDGTLWSGDAGADFFYWEIEHGLVRPEVGDAARTRYDAYKAGKVGEEEMCGEMVTLNRGLAGEVLSKAAAEFFEQVVSHRIFAEMQQLTRSLVADGCDMWAVSSTNSWLIEAAALHFGIAADHVLAAHVQVDGGYASDRLVRVPTDELKAVAIREVIGKPIDAVFGNSIHDHAMLQLARNPFCINPNPDLEQVARQEGWTVYWPIGSEVKGSCGLSGREPV